MYCRNPESKYDDGTTITNFEFSKGGITKADCFEPVDNDEYGQKIRIQLKNAGEENSTVLVPMLSEKPIFLFVEQN